MVFSPPVNLPAAQINRTSTVGPPPGLIPIGLTVVNEITMPRPAELHPEVMNISPNISVPPCPQIIPVCNNIDVPVVATSADIDNENMKSFSNSRESSANTEDENYLRGDDDEEGSKSAKIIADLKNRERRNKKVRPKDYYKKFEGTELSTNQASDVMTAQCVNQNKDFDNNVPSGKIENNFNPNYFSDTISFFDTEVSPENGILCDSPSLELLMDKHKQHPMKIFDQKDSNCSQVPAKMDMAEVCKVEALAISDAQCQPRNKPNEKLLFKDSTNCDIISADKQNKGNCKRDKHVKTVPAPVIDVGGCSKEQFQSSVDDEPKVDADNVSSTEKVKTEANNQINASTTVTTTATSTATTTTTKKAPADPAQPKPKMSWAGLFKNTLSTSNSIVVYSGSSKDNGVSSPMQVSSTALATGTSGTVQSAIPSSQKTSPDHQFVKENSPQPQAPVSPANDSLAKILGGELSHLNFF